MVRESLYDTLFDLVGREPDTRAMTSLFGIDAAIGTTIGLTREENQDRSIVVQAKSPDGINCVLIAVADGMGGMVSGSDCARRALADFVCSFILNTSPLVERLKTSVLNANSNVYSEYGGRGGATLSAIACIDNGEIAFANVGDSRIYSFDSSGMELLTEDDTLAAHVARLKQREPDADQFTPDLDEDFIVNQLVQYIGIGSAIEPHVVSLSADSGKGFILSTDGVHRLPHSIVQQITHSARSARDVVSRLLTVADWTGGIDNATVVAFFPESLGQSLAGVTNSNSIIIHLPVGYFEILGLTASVKGDEVPAEQHGSNRGQKKNKSSNGSEIRRRKKTPPKKGKNRNSQRHSHRERLEERSIAEESTNTEASNKNGIEQISIRFIKEEKDGDKEGSGE